VSPATRVPRHPPGRGGRLWLQRRLATARRGAGLLDLKVRLLRREEERFTALAQRTGARWEERCAEAERWLLRAAGVGGQRGLRPDGRGAARVAAAEVVTTRGRLRAIEDRWVPELESALHTLDGALAELERAEGVRLRWAANKQGRSRGASPT